MTLSEKKEMWLDHLRSMSHLFPREFGLKRAVLINQREYIAYLTNQWNNENCYTSVYSEYQISKHLVDVLFIEGKDFTKDDGSEIESLNDLDIGLMTRMVEETRNVVEKFWSFKVYPRVLFSAGRGFHYYIDFEPTEIRHLRYVAEKLLKDCSIPFGMIDMHVVGNARAMARIPGTINLKTGLFCVPVDIFDSPLNILKYSMVCKPTHTSTYPNEDFDLYLKDGDEEAANRTYDGEQIFLGPTDGDLYPPCIVGIISKLNKTGYLTHDERLHLTAYLRQSGWDRDDVFKLFEQSNDWKDRVTRYHVKYAYTNKALCYKCSNAKKLKFCGKKEQRKCPFYPSINRTAFRTANGVNGNGELQSERKIPAS